MIGLGLSLTQVAARAKVQPFSYDAAATALFAAMNVQPSAARKLVINTLILALKAPPTPVWDHLDILYVMAAHDEQAARLNWKNPSTFALVNGGTAPTFTTDRGFQGDGVSGRLNTGWVPSINGVNYLQDDASFWVWFTTNTASNTVDVGNATAPMARAIMRSATSTMNGYLNDNTNSAMASGITDGRGLCGFTRPSSATKKAWRNGVAVGADVAVTSTGRPTQAQWLLGANSSIFSAKQQAAGAWGASLAGLEAAFYTPLAAYMTAVGAA